MNDDYRQLEGRLLDLISCPRPCPEPEWNGLALDIYRFQRTYNLPYRRYCEHLGAPEDPSHWSSIPAVPQTAFKHSALRIFPAELTAKTFRTSGTTGEGFGEHHFLSTRLYDAAILHGWDYFQLPRLRQIILTPSPSQAPYSSLSHMMGCLKQRAKEGSQHFCIGPDGRIELEHLRRAIETGEPLLLMGTALAFLHLFETGEDFQLPPGSFALETGGYKGSKRVLTKAELYAMFEEHLGLPADSVINEYGMTELSSQFFTRGIGNPHLAPPWLKTVLVSPESGEPVKEGETGIVRIFDLANLGSVLAIQTNDLAILRREGFELLGRDPAAIPRGCSRAADEMLGNSHP